MSNKWSEAQMNVMKWKYCKYELTHPVFFDIVRVIKRQIWTAVRILFKARIRVTLLEVCNVV